MKRDYEIRGTNALGYRFGPLTFQAEGLEDVLRDHTHGVVALQVFIPASGETFRYTRHLSGPFGEPELKEITP